MGRAGPTCGWALGRGRGPPLACGAPPRLPSGLRIRLGLKIIPMKFRPVLRIFLEVDFLKYKNSKNRKLTLGILSIGVTSQK